MFGFIKRLNKGERGQSLIELLMAMGLISILLPAILTGIVASRGGRAQDVQRVGAVQVLKDAQEAVRSIHSRDWTQIETNGTYHPEVSVDRWILSPGTQTVDGFTTSVVIGDVYRDSGGAIVTSGGVLDSSTKEVVVTVSWSTPFNSSISSTNYFTRTVNYVHTDTTLADFENGATSSATTDVTFTNTNGGEVVLGSGSGNGDWCTPEEIVEEVDLPKNGVANAIAAIEGKISVGTGENASGVSFASLDVGLEPPAIATIDATFDGFKTNDVFGEEDFAYLATDTNSKEVVIMNLNEFSDAPTNSKYKEEGYFDAPGNGSAETVFALGDYGYTTIGDKFYVFDISSKAGSRSQVNSSAVTLSGTGVELIVNGNYAYVATDNTTNQLQIIDVTDPANPAIEDQITVDGGIGRDVAVNTTATRAYLATANSAIQNEFFILNIEDKQNIATVSGGTYNTNGMDPTGVAVVTGNRAIIVGTGGTEQYQVINMNFENSLSRCGGYVVSSGIRGLDAVLQSNGYAYSYIITGDSTSELKIILGGSGGGSLEQTGIFESYVFEAATEAGWNFFTATSSIPQTTTLQFRVAVKSGISGKCSGVTFVDSDFVGSDGLTSSYYPSTGGLIPFVTNSPGYSNPGRCMKYRAYFDTTEITQTPVLFDVSLNYSL